jgi:uridine kinase
MHEPRGHDPDISELIARIASDVHRRAAPAGMGTKIVAVDGLAGSGKSTFAHHLAAALDARVVPTDDFASWDDPVDWWPTLLERLLVPLARGQTAHYEKSHWGGPMDGLPMTVEPGGNLVLEGVTASREAFAPYLTYAIWVEAPAALRLRRGLDRDGAGALSQWREWMAVEDEYLRRERPDERADLVVHGDRDLWT